MGIINIEIILIIYIKLYKRVEYYILELFIFSKLVIILIYIIFNIFIIINGLGV